MSGYGNIDSFPIQNDPKQGSNAIFSHLSFRIYNEDDTIRPGKAEI